MSTKEATALEIKVLAIIRRHTNFLKYQDLLKADFFRSIETKTIFKCIHALHKKFKKEYLTIKQIWIYLEPHIDDDEYALYKRILLKIKADTEEDQDIVEYTITRFARENLLANELSTAVNQLASGLEIDINSFRTNLDRIANVSGSREIKTYDYFKQTKRRHDPVTKEYRLPTGISKELDSELDGGLSAGELAFFLAPTGRGKTLALVNIGANALRMGKRVLHITLEIPDKKVAERYDTCLTEMTKHEIKEAPEQFQKKLLRIRKLGGELIIHDFTYTYFTISQMNGLLEEMWQKNNKVDVIVLDYADLLIPPDKVKESRFELNRLYQELRILAGRFQVPVWTASQSNRNSLNKRVVSMADVAEAFGKTNIADLILALCQTDEEKEDKEMRIFIAKTRMGERNPIITCHSDLARMVLKSGREIDSANAWHTPRIRQLRKRNNPSVRN